MALERPVCALQVRRGDKHVEAPPAPLEQYMSLLVNATAEAGYVWMDGWRGSVERRLASNTTDNPRAHHHSVACRTIFVATDDQVGVLPMIKADAKSAFPGARVAWLRSE